MSSAPKAKPTQEIELPPQRAGIAAAVEECLERTATLLLHAGAASKEDLIHAINLVRQSHAQGIPADLLDTLARHLGHAEEILPAAIGTYAERISHSLVPTPPLIPFAGRFVTPTAFYDNYPELAQLGHALLSPVIYAEDADAIGTAALNPVAALIMSEEIMAIIARRAGIRPFVTAVILDHTSWAALVRKHFSR